MLSRETDSSLDGGLRTVAVCNRGALLLEVGSGRVHLVLRRPSREAHDVAVRDYGGHGSSSGADDRDDGGKSHSGVLLSGAGEEGGVVCSMGSCVSVSVCVSVCVAKGVDGV